MAKTKVIWSHPIHGWDNLVWIRLYKELIKQPWMTGKTITFGGANTYPKAKKKYNADNDRHPRCMELTMPIGESHIEVRVNWDVSMERFSIELHYPEEVKSWCDNNSYKSKPRASRCYEGTMVRIKQAFEDGLPQAQKENADILEDAKLDREEKEYRKELSTRMGVDLGEAGYNDSYTWGTGREYCLKFERQGAIGDEELFEIETINGKFTAEEIKALIYMIGNTPRALASRLIGKKKKH